MAKEIIINGEDFAKGIGTSSYTGLEEVRCCDINNKPGIIRASITTAKNSGATVTDFIRYSRKDSGDNIFMVSGITPPKLYKRTSAGIWSNIATLTETGLVTGLEVWKDYVLVLFSSEIVTIKISDGTENKAFQSLTAGIHPSIVGPDDKVYIGNEQTIASLAEDTTFDPTSGDTYTIDKNALDLPDGVSATTLTFLGSKLYIGTSEGTIYPWDTTSTSFDLPITVVKGQAINSMITANQRLYIQSGDKMKIYVSDGNSIAPYYELPETLIGNDYQLGAVRREAMVAIQDKLYIGFGSGSVLSPLGIYSIDLNTKQTVLEHIISTGEDGSTNGIYIGTIIATNKDEPSFLYSWKDLLAAGDLYGVDGDTSTEYTGDKAYFTSRFYQVGTAFNKATFETIQGTLAKPMVGNDIVKIYYRKSKAGTFSLIATFDTDGIQSFETGTGIYDATEVQFRVFLNNEAELLELRIK